MVDMTAVETKPKDSELSDLLRANAERDLSIGEFQRAVKLIAEPVFSETPCWLCEMHPLAEEPPKPSIYDIGLCQGHATHVLYTGR